MNRSNTHHCFNIHFLLLMEYCFVVHSWLIDTRVRATKSPFSASRTNLCCQSHIREHQPAFLSNIRSLSFAPPLTRLVRCRASNFTQTSYPSGFVIGSRRKAPNRLHRSMTRGCDPQHRPFRPFAIQRKTFSNISRKPHAEEIFNSFY